MKLYVRPDGAAQCLYSDDISLTTLGHLDIKRASHVEPDPAAPGQWYADLSPVGGPFLSGFSSRTDALAAEDAWLNTQMRKENVKVVT